TVPSQGARNASSAASSSVASQTSLATKSATWPSSFSAAAWGRGSPSSKPGMLSRVGSTSASTITSIGGSGGLGCPHAERATATSTTDAVLKGPRTYLPRRSDARGMAYLLTTCVTPSQL